MTDDEPPLDVETPTPSAASAKRVLLAAIWIAAVGGAALFAFLVLRPTAEKTYLAEIKERSLGKQFAGDKPAIAYAEQVCAGIDTGKPAQGSDLDAAAVRSFCPDYTGAFKVLSDRDIEGTFTLYDKDEVYLTPCEGDGGYGDIGASTQVIVKNQAGVELARTELGPGKPGISSRFCEFRFKVHLVEGESKYIVSVGKRGESSMTWEELIKPDALALSLGL